MSSELEIIDFGREKKEGGFNLPEGDEINHFWQKNKGLFLFLILGLIFLGVGVFWYRSGGFAETGGKVEVLEEGTGELSGEVVVEVVGAVEKPGVYRLKSGSRVDDALVVAGGLAAEADRDWVAKMVNRAAKLTDGQKIFIPDKQSESPSANKSGGYQTGSDNSLGVNTKLININTAGLQELDSLPGIGQVYAQKIIEQRPYSNTGELVSKKVIPQSTYEKIKDKISIY